MKNIKCHLCDSNLEITDIKGTVFPWKEFSYVKLMVSFNTLACPECGEILLKGSEGEKLDTALEKSIRMQTANFLQNIKNTSALSQKQLAKRIGITEVYFSEIISMKKTVSYQIFNYIKILANHPDNLNDLGCFEGNCDRNESIQIPLILTKFTYLEEDDVEQLKYERVFKGMLSDHNNISRVYH